MLIFFNTDYIEHFKVSDPGLYAATNIGHKVTGLQHTVYWKSYTILYMHRILSL